MKIDLTTFSSNLNLKQDELIDLLRDEIKKLRLQTSISFDSDSKNVVMVPKIAEIDLDPV